MCILIYKEPDHPLLKKKVYKRCFTSNPDGAGFAWWDEELQTWHVKKGLMDFKTFWRTINKENAVENLVNKKLFVHFRVGTSGNRKGPDCTHPFPIIRHYDNMRHTEFVAPNIAFHNGVIGTGWMDKSDTMIGVHDYVAPLLKHLHEEGVEDILEELLQTTKCRWAITTGKTIRMYGTWIEDNEYPGYHFSNRAYEEPAPIVRDIIHTSRWFRHGDVTPFLGEDGKWDWQIWKDRQNGFRAKDDDDDDDKEEDRLGHNGLIVPNKVLEYIDAPATAVGMLDADGNIEWEDDYDPAEDLLSCAGCGSDNVNDNTGTGNAICIDCGCIFSVDHGEIVMYDKSFSNDQDGRKYCRKCGAHMETGDWGDCITCGDVIDQMKMEARVAEDQEEAI